VVIVAILDGPVELDHPCFAGVEVVEDDILQKRRGQTASAHGTQIASIVTRVAQADSPVTALRLLSIPIFSSADEDGAPSASQLELAQALNRALEAGAHIINVSSGQLVESPHADPRLERALKTCADRDVLLVAAAGNEGCDCIHVPAAVASTLVVGAMNDQGQPLKFSNWGAAYRDHGILAPGEDIPVALPDGKAGVATGTSHAAALVSGAAARLMGELLRRKLAPSGAHVRAVLLRSAIGCEANPVTNCDQLLVGRFDPSNALRLLFAPDPTIPLAAFSESPKQTGIFMSSEQSIDTPSGECNCASKGDDTQAQPKIDRGPSLTYALGRISVDFGTQSNRDSFVQRGVQNPDDPTQLLAHLQQNPWAAADLTWTLLQDTVPIYAVRPAGAFAAHIHSQLASFLADQNRGKIELVALPGYSGGTATLVDGQRVPVLYPNPRGMTAWRTSELLEAVISQHGDAAAGLSNFLERVFYELRNLGTSPEERALNAVATQALNHAGIFAAAHGQKLTLDTTEISKAPVSRPGSDCWDVKLIFFNPAERLTQARQVYRITIDVSGPLPVVVGTPKQWHVY
jgi:subtilisin family serine protease